MVMMMMMKKQSLKVESFCQILPKEEKKVKSFFFCSMKRRKR